MMVADENESPTILRRLGGGMEMEGRVEQQHV